MLFSAYPFCDKNSKILFLMNDVMTFKAVHWSLIGRKRDGSSVVNNNNIIMIIIIIVSKDSTKI